MSEWVYNSEVPIDEPVVVQVDKSRRPYQVAYFSKEGVNIIGNHFSFDVGNVIRWKRFLNEEDE